MRRINFRLLVGIPLLIVSTMLLVWGLAPPRKVIYAVQITTADLGFISPGEENSKDLELDASKGLADQHISDQIAGDLRIEWPENVRVGDLVEIRLSFFPDPLLKSYTDFLQTDSAEQPGSERHPLRILSARLEMAGLDQRPSGTVSQAISFDHPLIFLWRLRARQKGAYSGGIWLTSAPGLSTGADTSHVVVLNRIVSLLAGNLLGMNGLESRFAGAVGLAAGFFLVIQNLIHKKIHWAAIRDERNSDVRN